MICRVITERWLIGRRCLSASTCAELPAAAVSAPLPGGRRAGLIYPAARPCGFPMRRAPPVFCLVPLLCPPILPTRRLCNPAIRKGEPLPPHRDNEPAFPYWSISRPLTLSPYIMAASGKIDLNSPSTTWKEAKTILKSLNKKQRREQYGAKDFIKLKDIPTWKDTAKKIKAKQPEEVKFPKNKDLIEKISFFRGDITKLEVDAIVNAGHGIQRQLDYTATYRRIWTMANRKLVMIWYNDTYSEHPNARDPYMQTYSCFNSVTLGLR